MIYIPIEVQLQLIREELEQLKMYVKTFNEVRTYPYLIGFMYPEHAVQISIDI